MSRSVAIGNCVEACQTWNPMASDPDMTFQYIDLSSVDREQKRIAKAELIPCGSAPSRARQLVKAGDILISTVRPNLNGVAIVPVELDGATASTGFTVLRAKEGQIDRSYLFHWVKHPRFIDDMVSKATGASYPAVSDRIVRESLVPLPALPEQRRIAAILDKADALRATRREVITKLDQLLQSVFLSMFGEPLSNPMKWPKRLLADVALIQTGGTPPTSEAGMFDGDIPFITPGDLGGVVETWRRTVTQEGADKIRVAKAGSTLVCCIGATIGKMGLLQRDSTFNQQINSISWKAEIVPEYGYHAMRFLSAEIAHKGASTTLPILKKSEFEKLELIVPPRSEQKRFSEAAQSITAHLHLMQSSMSSFDLMFGSLQQALFED